VDESTEVGVEYLHRIEEARRLFNWSKTTRTKGGDELLEGEAE